MKLNFNSKSFLSVLVILVFLGVMNVHGNTITTFNAQYSNDSIENFLVNTSGCEFDGEQYHVTGDDPQLTYDFNKDGKIVYAVKIKLKKKINLSDVTVYYGNETPNFSENNTTKYPSVESDVIEFESDKGFKYLRLDINKDTQFVSNNIAYSLQKENESNTIKYIVVFVISCIIAAICGSVKKISEVIMSIIKQFIVYSKKILQKKKQVGLLFVVFIFEAGAAVLAEKIYISFSNGPYINRFRILMYFTIMFLITFTIAFWKHIEKYTHIFYFVVVLSVGTLHVVAAPPAAGISWDDEIHYGRAAHLSWNISGNYSKSDSIVINRYGDVILGRDVYERVGRERWINEINDISINGNQVVEAGHGAGLGYVAYIPSAIGLNIGRGLGMSFIHTFMIGKWMNLICYSLILSISIWLLEKRGKIIVALIGVIPTSLFMASSYSYDWWVVSLVILSFSILFSKWQNEEKVSTKCMVVSMVVFIIALLPKAIYFPLVFPMLFLSSKKFEDSKKAKSIITATMFLLLISFALPMLMSADSRTDLRGGNDVNSAEQVSFILTNPVEYTKILLNFLKDYLSLDSANKFLTYLGYYSHANYSVIHLADYATVCIALIFMGMIIDNNKNVKREKSGKINKFLVCFSIFGTVVLVATALYVSFTPVGCEMILGCQARYLLPVLFLLIYTMAECKIDISKKTKSNYFAISTLIMLFIFINAINEMCISLY